MVTRTASVVARLRDLVLSGAIPAGERIVELNFAPRLGASRTPLRLALAELEREGLVERLPRRGYRVRSFTIDDVANAVDVRGTLEGMAARVVAERGLTADEETQLQQCIDEGERLVHGRGGRVDPERWAGMNARFHRVLVEGSANNALIRAVAQNDQVPLAAASAIAFSAALRGDVLARMRRAHDDHVGIFEALHRRESGRAESLLREHAYRSRDNKRALIESLSGGRVDVSVPLLHVVSA
jgi:GntR family transcriptional regulator of vanillate catabolism